MTALRCIRLVFAAVLAGAVLATAASAARPNIVIVLTDDQRADGADRMPVVQDRLAAHGVTFSNAFVTNSLCCPSRTTLLTGRYSHATGVWSNTMPFGAWRAFRQLGAERQTIAVALRAAGYRTSLIGKYLNGYGAATNVNGYGGATIPPGWNEWRSFVFGQGYYGYTLNLNGALLKYGEAPEDYSTDVLAGFATDFIRRSATSSRPFFLLFAPAAPHEPAIPAPRHADVDLGLPPFAPPSLNEDLADKPEYMRLRAKPPGAQTFRTNQYRTLLAVDEAVGLILDELEATDTLRNTIVVFMSDNGVEWGEHGFGAAQKSVPHEGSIRVPFIVRYDRLVAEARTDERLVTNLDVAPTLASLAGIRFPSDGANLVPLLRDSATTGWRKRFLVEHLGQVPSGVPSYCGIRSRRFLYTLYATGEQELYDLAFDPYELDNRAGDPLLGDTRRHLLRQVRRLCYPLPPGYHPGRICTLTGTARGDNLTGTRGRDFVCLGGGHDRVSTGNGADTVHAAAPTIGAAAKATFVQRGFGPLGSTITTGPGDDRIFALNGRRDTIRCGAGDDELFADRFDLFGRDCELVANFGRRPN